MCFAKSCKYFLFKSQLAQYFNTSETATKICLRKSVQTLLADCYLYLPGKLLWTTLLLMIQRTGAEPLLELLLVSFIFALCVKRYLRISRREGSFNQHLKTSSRVKIRRGVLKAWSNITFRQPHHSLNWNVSRRQAHRKKTILLALMAFLDIATRLLEPSDVYIIFV